MMLKRLFILLLLGFSLAAHAGRVLPMNVQVGQLYEVAYPNIRIGGETYRIAPGARIYDSFNRMVIAPSLQYSGKVYYQLDSSGMLFQMWLPTPDEEAAMNR